MSADPDPGMVNRHVAPWKLQLQLVLALGSLMIATSIWFVRGPQKPPRPPGEPARWKLAVWFAMFFLAFPVLFILLGRVETVFNGH